MPGTDHKALRIGVLGAARIAPASLIQPAKKLRETVRVIAVAARQESRARQFARKHGVPHVSRCYDELLEDTGIDAVYIPLPNSLHAVWSEKALDAGKHVLCEKPLACNAMEADHLRAVANRTGLVLSEAMHYRHHPLARRIREIVDSDVLGDIEHIEARISFPVVFGKNIRYQYALGGGSAMDQGCYAVSLIRFITRQEPRVVHASARLSSPAVDREMTATMTLPGGATARLKCSIWSRELLRCSVHVKGKKGEMKIINPVAPHFFHFLRWNIDGRTHYEWLRGRESSFYYQLKAFADAVRSGGEIITSAAEASANMRVIDELYRKAALPLRGLAALAE